MKQNSNSNSTTAAALIAAAETLEKENATRAALIAALKTARRLEKDSDAAAAEKAAGIADGLKKRLQDKKTAGPAAHEMTAAEKAAGIAAQKAAADRRVELYRDAEKTRAAIEKAAAAEKAAEQIAARRFETMEGFFNASDAEQIAVTGKMLWKATKNALAAGRPWAWLLVDSREQIDAARGEMIVSLYSRGAESNAAGIPFGLQLYRAAADGLRAVYNDEMRAGRGIAETADDAETAAARIAAPEYDAPHAAVIADDLRRAVCRDRIDAAIIDALNDGRGYAGAARDTGLHINSIYKRIDKIRIRAAAYAADVETDSRRA